MSDAIDLLTAWVPAITSSTVVGILGFVSGAIFKARVEKGLQHHFDGQLEALKGGIRKEEEEFKAALRRSDEQMAAMRGGALSGVAARHAALSARRSLAVERVWSEVVELSRLKFISSMTGQMNMDALLERASKGRDAKGVRDFAESLLKAGGAESTEVITTSRIADKERPFLGPVAWALFEAYRQLLLYPVMQLNLAKAGVGREMLKDDAPVLATMTAALPTYAEFIKSSGTNSLSHLVQPLEERLLAALSDVLDGKDADEAAVQHAHQVLNAVAKMTAQAAEAAVPTAV